MVRIDPWKDLSVVISLWAAYAASGSSMQAESKEQLIKARRFRFEAPSWLWGMQFPKITLHHITLHTHGHNHIHNHMSMALNAV